MGAPATITTIATDIPRVYVACLSAYNAGRLHGAWIEAAQEPWAIWDEVQAMLRTSPMADAEEWAIHDHEGFGSYRPAEYADFETVSAVAGFLTEHGPLGAALLNHFDGDVEEARAALNERYLGAHASLADYLQELTGDSTAIPTALSCYIDWQAMARDAELNGDLFALAIGWNGVHVFAGS